jgi:hypothetical protein
MNAPCESDPAFSGSGRAGVSGAAHGLAAESAKADFAIFQRRIHSLQRDGTLPDPILKNLLRPTSATFHSLVS